MVQSSQTEMDPAADSRTGTNATQSELWQVELNPASGFPDRGALDAAEAIADLNLDCVPQIESARGFLLEGQVTAEELRQIACQVLAEPIVHVPKCGRPGGAAVLPAKGGADDLIYVMPKPGVTDPVAESALELLQQLGFAITAVRSYRRYLIAGANARQREIICKRVLCNDAIEQLVFGPLSLDQLHWGSAYQFKLLTVPLLQLDGDGLDAVNREMQLSLSVAEMQAIQAHFRGLGREPTDVELETVAQTWSEHCSHKTLAGRIDYDDGVAPRQFENMLRETIFAATTRIREELGNDDWCVSVFRDNAGVVRFDDDHHLTFKVETHNRPSALEPYGGANTGLGGVLRDTLGTGLGAKPICSTDVFCFAPPDSLMSELPPGVLHPRRIMKGVVAGVRDYGNRMGIPTVNGAVFFDPRYVGNPLVFCGSVGLLPRGRVDKCPQPDDLIVVIGGRTGRDGIHGATFSSAELTDQSERVSGGAVQIGNAITEKMFMDVLLQARDAGLYNAVTDCGAGGFSSAVGEMGESLGAEVWLEKAPLKYQGLSYTEIWISEAQERMVLAVPPRNWQALEALCRAESVEATVLGKFVPSGELTLKYGDHVVGKLAMEFLHRGRPQVVRRAVYQQSPSRPVEPPSFAAHQPREVLLKILATPTVASKHWIIRQYDHEVLGGSAVKPLVGRCSDGPSDAAIVRPLLDSRRGVVVACGINPLFGDLDPYHHAASVIDEAVRNAVAVGADPARIGILDNFCWGRTDRPETLGGLVRTALACHDVAVAYRTPFISGKDSLHNEFSYRDADSNQRTVAIPGTLLISAIGQIDEVERATTMDLKSPGNLLFQVGWTSDELGGSHALLVTGRHGQGFCPQIDLAGAPRIFAALHRAIMAGDVVSCHDLSEGGLAVALSEMCLAGRLGASIDVSQVPWRSPRGEGTEFDRLFAESNTRFVCEVPLELAPRFTSYFPEGSVRPLGEVASTSRLRIASGGNLLLEASVDELLTAWQQPLNWS